ncbi:MAG: hypothetical protein J6V40_04195 [Clostridia bacterium]|nr:hypothetical protein [Clostridia bacterium]
MGLFKSKAEKEFEKKMVVKKTINSMNKQISTLEEQKNIFVEKAKEAKKKGLEAQYNLALSGYRMTYAQQKKAQEMLLNFEITSQMKDMTMMTSEFLKGMSLLSREMSKLADSKQFSKVQKEFEIAMNSVEEQSSQMEVFLESAETTFDAAASSEKQNISDEDFEKMIDEESAQDIGGTDAELDRQMEELKKKIDAELE